MSTTQSTVVNDLIATIHGYCRLLTNPEIQNDRGRWKESIQLVLEYMNNYVTETSSQTGEVEGNTFCADVSILLKANLDQKAEEHIWQILTLLVTNHPQIVRSILDTGLIANLVTILNDDLSKIQQYHAQALDKIIYRADKKDTQDLLSIGIIPLCIRLLKHKDLHCMGSGIYTLTNLIVDCDNRKDGEEHPLGQRIRTYNGDDILLELFNRDSTSVEYRNTIALTLCAIYQGIPLPAAYGPVVEHLKQLASSGTEWEIKNSLLRLRLLSPVEANQQIILSNGFLETIQHIIRVSTDTFHLRHSLQLLLNLIRSKNASISTASMQAIDDSRMVELTKHTDSFVRQRAEQICAAAQVHL